MTVCYGGKSVDIDWGCEFTEVLNGSGIEYVKICHVHVADISKISKMLATSVVDTSWMMSLDPGTRSSYEYTVQETAELLVKIFNAAEQAGSIVDEFGELMVSMGSARALEVIFKHTLIPIAELWKPQAKQNEGFDFHSVCPREIINFGEAKYCSGSTSYGRAMTQAGSFLKAHKHKRDRVHLLNLASPASIENLDSDVHGVIASFSLHSRNHLSIYKNVLGKAKMFADDNGLRFVYMIGVTHES